jgi:alpha-1,2-mannosyltransferase
VHALFRHFIHRFSAISCLIPTLSLLALTYYATLFVTSDDTLDLRIYLDSAERLRSGHSLYNVRFSFPERAADFELQYLYPPALAALLAPFSLLPRQLVIVLWQLGLVAAVAASASLLVRLITVTNTAAAKQPYRWALFPLIAFWPPTLDGILWGQVNGYILLLLTYAAYSALRKNELATGLSLGLAAALKGTPIVLAIPLLIHRRWLALGSCLIGGIAAHLPLLLYPNGLQAIYEFLRTTGEIAAGDVVNDPYYDYSFRRIVSMFIELAPQTLSLISLGLLALFVIDTLRGKGSCAAQQGASERLCALQMVGAIPIMMMISPLLWFHHLVWLFPVLIIAAARAPSAAVRRSAWCCYLALAPLLYVHVYIRHFTDLNELIIKPLPVLLTAMSYLLLRSGLVGALPGCSSPNCSTPSCSKATPR